MIDMKLKSIIPFGALAAVAFLVTACADTDAQYTIPDVAAPIVTATYPAANEEIGSPGEITMTVKYDKRIFFASSSYTKLQFTGGTIDRATVYGMDSVLTIHATGLQRGVPCQLTIPAGLVTGPNNQPAPETTLAFSIRELPPVATKPVVATSAKAISLYNFLRENYRTNIISGMMASVAWNNDESEHVFEWTGKYPAINGYDYIHLPASVRGANWINYGDITPVKTWFDNGGIINCGWHWLAPKVEIGEGGGDEPAGEAETVWEGQLNVGTEWGVSDQIGADKFANAQAGTLLTFYYATNSDADYWQAKLMDSSWNALTGYKDVDNGWGCIALDAGTNHYSFALTADDAAKLREGGMVISGYGITYTMITLTNAAGAKQNAPRRAKRYSDLDPNNDFSYSAGVFDLKAAVTEGTWQNQFVKDDLARIAPYLKLLRDAGIPVLWRPLHEAAGGWFWWGSDAESFKKLWIMMFDYFKQEGLDNLIWVWTSEGDDLNWYPGPEYVDIIGRDLYGNSVASCIEEYQKLQENYPGKIITLSECGYSQYTNSVVAPISQQWNEGATWSWFMPWYGTNGGNENMHAGKDWWTDAMNCPNVITRDKVKY